MKKLHCLLAAIFLAAALMLTPSISEAGKISMVNNSADYCFIFRIKSELYLDPKHSGGVKTHYYRLKAKGKHTWDDIIGSIEYIDVARVPKDKCNCDTQSLHWDHLWSYVNTCGANPFRTFKATVDEQGQLELVVWKQGC